MSLRKDSIFCISLFISFFLFLTFNISSVSATEINYKKIKAEWLKRSPILRSYKTYDEVKSEIQKAYKRFKYPNPLEYDNDALFKDACQKIAESIMNFAILNIKIALQDDDVKCARANMEIAEEKLASYGKKPIQDFHAKIQPILKNFYIHVLQFQGNALGSFFHSLGKQYQKLLPWREPLTWDENAA